MTTYILDTETTGVVEPIEPVEVGWLRLENLVAVEEGVSRFRPSKPIELGALATHHIMDEDLVNRPPSSEAKLPEDCTIIIGSNVDYDWKVMGSPRVRRIDVMAMVWRAWPELGKCRLGAALYHVDRQRARQLLQESHSALQDCRNTLIVLQAISDHLGGFASWKEMWEWSEEARVPKIIPFGKHKDTPFNRIPLDYLEWMLNEPDMDPYMKKAARRAIRETYKMINSYELEAAGEQDAWEREGGNRW